MNKVFAYEYEGNIFIESQNIMPASKDCATHWYMTNIHQRIVLVDTTRLSFNSLTEEEFGEKYPELYI